MKNLILEGVVLFNLGALELAQGRFDVAGDFLEQALARTVKPVIAPDEGKTLAVLARMRNLQQRPAEALALLVDGESLLREIDNPLELAGLLCVKGASALAIGDRDAARSALNEAEHITARLTASGSSRLTDDLDELRRAVGYPRAG